MHIRSRYYRNYVLYASVAAAASLAGCASQGVQNPAGAPVTEMRPDERGKVAGTGIESQDLVAVTDKMARGILAARPIVNTSGVPRIVIDPVVNDTRFTLNKDLFTDRIRALLNERANGKVVFLARDRMAALEREQRLKQDGLVTATTNPNVTQFKGADFFLTGKLGGQTTRTTQGTSDYVLYTFQLINAATSEIVWEGFSEMKKQGLEDAAYR